MRAICTSKQRIQVLPTDQAGNALHRDRDGAAAYGFQLLDGRPGGAGEIEYVGDRRRDSRRLDQFLGVGQEVADRKPKQRAGSAGINGHGCDEVGDHRRDDPGRFLAREGLH